MILCLFSCAQKIVISYDPKTPGDAEQSSRDGGILGADVDLSALLHKSCKKRNF